MRAYTARDMIKLLRKAGYYYSDSTGGHDYYRFPGRPGSICVPKHPGDLAFGTAKNILKSSGLWEQERSR